MEQGREKTSSTASNAYPLTLCTGGNLLPYTHWQFRYLPQLRKRAPEPFLEIHPKTASRFKISDSETVELCTETGKIKVNARS